MVCGEKREEDSRSETEVPAPIQVTGIHVHVFFAPPPGCALREAGNDSDDSSDGPSLGLDVQLQRDGFARALEALPFKRLDSRVPFVTR